MVAGRFRIIALLGKGGMGEVYRADDTKLGHQVALKFLPRAIAADPKTLERLFAEVRVGRQVSHPNVCRLYDIGESDEGHFITMEYVDGEDLGSLLRRIGRLPADKALDIAHDLSAGLAAAHDVGIVHRDLKPANVMIDGRGRARITDFGLAAVAQDLESGGGFAGTPAYMAPEQLSGGPVTPRSDIYALGLLLYEIFTGKRLFTGNTFDEVRSQRRVTKPASMSSVIREIDPAIERVVMRCLEDDPAARPSSAHAVIASLPGGDPLAAAVAAGETPSPAMVAAAGQVGDLRPAIAWPMVIAALAGLVLIAAIAARVTLFGIVGLPKSTEVLDARGQEVAEHLGYTDPPAAMGHEWISNTNYTRYMAQRERGIDRWKSIARTRPGVALFAFRSSTKPMVALNADQRLVADDPAIVDPGMIRVVVDPAGRLIEYIAVPPEKDGGSLTPVDWNTPFREAAVDPSRFHAAPSQWTPPVGSDERHAWDGTLAEQTGIPVRIEAAARKNRIVWFRLYGPWDQPQPLRQTPQPLSQRLSDYANFALVYPVILASVFLAIRNLRRGRGDRKTAFRLAALAFATTLVALILRADHSGSLNDEAQLIPVIVGKSLYRAAVIWLLYIALEPYVRRIWPHALISWIRLLGGRFRDALVGRDVLIGVIGGLTLLLLQDLTRLAPVWLGIPPPFPLQTASSPFGSPRHVIYFLLDTLSDYTHVALALMVGLVVLRMLLRSRILAAVVMFIMIAIAFLGVTNATPALQVVYVILSSATLVGIAVRWGLLPLCVTAYLWGWLRRLPLTLDPSVWYFGRSFLVLAVVAALAIYGFVVALGDKPFFGAPLLED